MLMMEAYFRVLLATLDALYTNLSVDGELRDCSLPLLRPSLSRRCQGASEGLEDTAVRTALEPYGKYLALFDKVKQFSKPRAVL